MLLGLCALWLFEHSQTRPHIALEQVERRAPTRFVVFLVDSLAERDVQTPGRMPKLRARIARSGVHGPVRECADAITVPCMLAAITGTDHVSVFALSENFNGASGAIADSVLGQLEARGLRVGYYGDRMLSVPMQGLTRVVAPIATDEKTIETAFGELDSERLDIAIIHLKQVDEVAHAKGAESAAYARTVRQVDDQLEKAFAALRPTDSYVVMGDHGHTTTGHHAAGLEATTYAAFFGPPFARPLARPMAMTEHAATWARLFGYRRGPRSWVDDYFEGRPVAALTTLPPLDTGPGLPWWAACACIALSFPIAFGPRRMLAAMRLPRARQALALLLSAALVLTLGAMWLELRAFAWGSRTRIVISTVVINVLTATVGAALLRWLEPLSLPPTSDGERRYTLALGGAVLFAIPTVYWFGGASVSEAWLAFGLLLLAIKSVRGRLYPQACSAMLGCLLAASLVPVKLANYVLRGFLVYKRTLLPIAAPLIVVTFLGALWLATDTGRERRVTLISAAVGLAVAASMGHVPDTLFIAPCVLALPLVLLSFRVPLAWPLACLCVPPALWFSMGAAPVTIAPITAVGLLWALFPRLAHSFNPLLQSFAFVTLAWMSFWTAMGCRITGIDFDFYFRWLPAEAEVTSQWAQQALVTTAKYLLPASFGIRLAYRRRGLLHARLEELTALVARGRLGVSLLFLSALCAYNPRAGTLIVSDALQEAAFWVIVVGVLWLVFSLGRPAQATRTLPPAT